MGYYHPYRHRAYRYTLIRKGINEHLDNLGRSLVHTAVLSGEIEILEYLLRCLGEIEDQERAITTPGIDGMTPVHLSALIRDSQQVEMLLSNRPSWNTTSIDSADIWGRGPLHIATKFGNADVASRLLQEGMSMDRTDRFGQSALLYLLRQTQHQISPNTLDDFAKAFKPDSRMENDGKTFYHIAAELASIEMIRTLRRVDNWRMAAKARDRIGRTPLITAILTRRTNITIEFLEGLSSDALLEDASGMTPLMHACANGLVVVAERLACILVQQNEQTGAKQDNKGRTALHHAVSFKDENVVQQLIDSIGCNTKQDNAGRTAFHDALERGMDIVALSLLNTKDPIPNRDKDGYSVLITACKRNCVQFADAILSKWPELINVADELSKETPLACACEFGYVDIVHVLFRNQDIDPNITAKWQNYTPLHLAVRSSRTILVEFLLQQPKVDDGLSDDRDRTPLDLAIDDKDMQLVRLFYKHRSDSRSTIDALDQTPSTLFIDIFPDLLEKLKDSLITNDDLEEWTNRSVEMWENGESAAPLVACLHKLVSRNMWNMLQLPCHTAAQVGEFSAIEQMISKGADNMQLDADNWSWADYAGRHSGKDIHTFEGSTNYIKDLNNRPPQAKPKVPTRFITEHDTVVSETPCDKPGHRDPNCGLLGKLISLPFHYSTSTSG